MDVASYPRGVLSLLDAKTLGVGFGQSADFIQPTLDLERFLSAPKRSNEGAVFAAITGGFNVPACQVPNNETWILRAASANVGAAAASSAGNCALALRMPGSTSHTIIGTPTGPLAATESAWTVLTAYDLVLIPGSEISVSGSSIVGTVAVEMIANVDRLRC